MKLNLKLFFAIALCFSGNFLYAQNVNAVIKEADDLEVSMKDAEAINKYKEALKIQPKNIYALCKCSELCSRIGGRLKDDKDKQDDFYTAAKTYAYTALQVDAANSDANFSMALVMGRDAIRKGGKDKIAAVKDVKKYADLSLRYDPKNYKAWYVLGKWYYEVNSLNYFERSAVKIFYGALPSASIEDAIICLEKSKSLNPNFILSYLSLAKAYEKKDQDNIARQNILVMLTLPDKTQDDEKIKSEGRDLLKKLD